jgi:WD40 repeat protein
LFSGSDDKTIRVWNTETYEIIATLRAYTDWDGWVYSLTIHKNKLYSGRGGGDKNISVWKI